MNSVELPLLNDSPTGCHSTGNSDGPFPPDGTSEPRPEYPWRRRLFHACRVLFVLTIVLLMHRHHRHGLASRQTTTPSIPLADVRTIFPDAQLLEAIATNPDTQPSPAAWTVRDASGSELGRVMQTSPLADHIIGFSGPTNMMVGLDLDGRIAGVRILSSGDTREHVAQVIEQREFLRSFIGKSPEQLAAFSRIDAVSGATLTSLAIAQSVQMRLGSAPASLKFPGPPALEPVQVLFPTARKLIPLPSDPSRWEVRDGQGVVLGDILQTTPAAESLIGYQGPTETLVGLVDDKIIGLAIGRSYDNEPYVTYVREEAYFLRYFNDKSLAEMGGLDLKEAGVEGVSGATMTSQNVADGVRLAAARHVKKQQESAATQMALAEEAAASSWWQKLSRKWGAWSTVAWTARDYGTIAVTLLGLCVAFSSWRGNVWVQRAWRVVLIGYLGFINGDLVSQALLVGWAKGGIPWRVIGGPLVLTIAAFLVPITLKRNVYCSHLCPHGAAQQWLAGRLPWQWHPSPRVRRCLEAIPAILLGVVVLVGMGAFTLSLVDIEPFDAYILRVAGWPTLGIAVVGLLASSMTPMAYCRFGCPTGGLLNYLRRHRRSDEITPADTFAVLLLLIAVCLLNC
ncbi:MAG: FMN-binding protein [Planctomycetaceae bacterium]